MKLLDTSVAISGEIPARPFTSADCCFLLTPNTRAPAVTLNPNHAPPHRISGWASTGRLLKWARRS